MSEYIRKAEAIERALYTPIMSNGPVEEKDVDAWIDGTVDAQEQIAASIGKIPAEDVVERKRGEWVIKNGHIVCDQCEKIIAVCPNCDQLNDILLELKETEKFCYNCGADMRMSHREE